MANADTNAEDFFWYEGKPPRRLPDAEGYGTGVDLLEDPLFANLEARQQHDTALAEGLGRFVTTKEPLKWEALLTAAEVACVKGEDRGPFYFYDDDAHVKENWFTTQEDIPRLNKFWRYSPLLKFSHTKEKAEAGTLKAQHTTATLRELGYSPQQINAFKERGGIGRKCTGLGQH